MEKGDILIWLRMGRQYINWQMALIWIVLKKEGKNGKRITRKFYSADPLANTAYALGMDMTYLDFDKLQKSEKIKKIINQSMLMGSLGEGYSFLNKILPNSYRINDVPAELYDGMIIVINATPTDIKH